MKALLFVVLSSLSFSAFSYTAYCNLGEVKYFVEGNYPTGSAYSPARGGEWNINDPHINQIESLLRNEYPRNGEWQTLPNLKVLDIAGTKLYPWVCSQGIFPDLNIPGERNYFGAIKMFLFPKNQENNLISTERSVLLPGRDYPYLDKFILPLLLKQTYVNIPKLEVNSKILNNLAGKTRLNTYAVVQGDAMMTRISCQRGEVIFTIGHGTPSNTYEVDGPLLTTGVIDSGERFSSRVLICN